MRFTRASMLEVVNQDYVRTARAKGLNEQQVTISHSMRNAMIPVVTIVALQIPAVFGGAVVTEQISVFRASARCSSTPSAVKTRQS